ncbi:hypothetical protein NLO413_0158 [Candidatus Neoehrlichia lotoris str. RAC413]|uniref:Uncharacterized protein n=1 Tax=Candidatus Neoehrlichia procyonis str. RAC413 TaxID=1359163 RepID=A0A0F3NL62_9RICK|nr:hypothetical protein NLO413_0158 [Candidatus Neoehrlichia lotoris str. RAC413]
MIINSINNNYLRYLQLLYDNTCINSNLIALYFKIIDKLF